MLEKRKKYGKILKFTEDYSVKNGYSPTVAEIAAAVKISPSTAFRYIKELEEAGFLNKSGGKKRGITLKSEKCREKSVPVPVYSEIFGNTDTLFYEENIIFYLWLPLSMFKNGQYFAIEADDTFFLPESVKNGDFIIFRKTRKATDGDVVLVRRGETTASALITYDENGFILTFGEGRTEKKSSVEIIGKAVAMQRLEF